jgi:cytochrome c-type biogenesis protein CcmE
LDRLEVKLSQDRDHARVAAVGEASADSVLANHDENYMPKEVADSLKAKGVWQESR